MKPLRRTDAGPSPRAAAPLLFAAVALAVAGWTAGALAQPDQSSTSSSTSSSTATTAEPTTTTTARPTTTTARPTTTTRPPTSTTTVAPSTTASTFPTTSSSAPTTTQTTQPQIIVPTTSGPGEGGGGEGGLSTDTKLALVVGGLVAVAVAIGVLTVLYWRHTRPIPGGGIDPAATPATGSPAVPVGVGAGASGEPAAAGAVTQPVPVGPVAPPPTAPPRTASSGPTSSLPASPTGSTAVPTGDAVVDEPPLELVTLEDLGGGEPMGPGGDGHR